MKAGQILAVLAGGWLTLAAWAEAPSIVLRDLDGKSRNVNEFIGRGQWTVVTTWAHDCHICSREIHEMSAFHLAHRGRDAIVLGVTVDGYDEVQAARAFVKRHDLPFVNLVAEPKQAVMTQFGAGRFVGTPTYYIYDPKGAIVGQQIGPLTREEVEAFMESFDAPAPEAPARQPKESPEQAP
jgi:peroxiredoxin